LNSPAPEQTTPHNEVITQQIQKNQKETKMTKNNSLNKEAVKQSIKSSNNQVEQAQTIDLKNKTRMLLASPFYKSKFETKFISGTSSVDHTMHLTVKQYPEGFTAFEEQSIETPNNEYGSFWMKYAGRDISVYNPLPVHEVPEIYSASKSRGRTTRRNIEAWQELLGSSGEISFSCNGYSVESALSKDISILSTKASRYEQYIPLAFKKDGKVTGGSYIYLAQTGVTEETKVPRNHISESRIGEFLIGSCMFGATLYGKDQYGNKHPLTNQLYQMPENCIIQSVDDNTTLHPDEQLTHKAFLNHIPLIKALSHDCPSINYHIPLSNYIIYGLNNYINGTITKNALTDYVALVKERALQHRSFLQDTCAEHAIALRITCTLDPLGLADSNNDEVFEQLLGKLQLTDSIKEKYTDDERVDLCNKIVSASINYLAEVEGEVGNVWKVAQHKLQTESFKLNKSEFDILHQLNYIDYSANLAVSVDRYDNREVCTLLPSMETPVQILYKKMFSEEFGPAMTMNWLPPVLIQMEQYRNRIFNLEDYLGHISALLDAGIIENSFLQMASVALDSPELAGKAAIGINSILSSHEMDIHLASEDNYLEDRFVG